MVPGVAATTVVARATASERDAAPRIAASPARSRYQVRVPSEGSW